MSSRRIFVGRLPLTITATQLRAALDTASGATAQAARTQVESIHWKVDQTSGMFYGSAFVVMSSSQAAAAVLTAEARGCPLDISATAVGVGSETIATPEGLSAKAVARRAGKARKKAKAKQKRVRLGAAPLRSGEAWPPSSVESELPPLC